MSEHNEWFSNKVKTNEGYCLFMGSMIRCDNTTKWVQILQKQQQHQ